VPLHDAHSDARRHRRGAGVISNPVSKTVDQRNGVLFAQPSCPAYPGQMGCEPSIPPVGWWCVA
jgi:hypothetical protein